MLNRTWHFPCIGARSPVTVLRQLLTGLINFKSSVLRTSDLANDFKECTHSLIPPLLSQMSTYTG